MREIRTYGSEGGVVQTNVLSLPLSEMMKIYLILGAVRELPFYKWFPDET